MAKPTTASTKSAPLAVPPGTIDAAGLAVLLFKKAETILSDARDYPQRVPPFSLIPDTRQPIWVLHVVFDWLASKTVVPATPRPRGRGRPTKREAIEKASRAAAAVGSAA